MEQQAEEKKYIDALHWLMSLPENKRDEHVLGILNAVIDGIEEALDKELLKVLFDKKAGLLDKKKPAAEKLHENLEGLLNDLKNNDSIIVACFMYSLKDKFRDVIVRMMEVINTLSSPPQS